MIDLQSPRVTRFFRCSRFFLELISFPFFIYLVFHFAAHGTGKILSVYFSDFFNSSVDNFGNILLYKKVIGVLFLCIFVYFWHRPAMKKMLPCSHEHCHGTKYLHILAIFAFVLHFFPEAILRHEIVQEFMTDYEKNLVSFAGVIGFGAHFLVDVVTGIMLSLYFKSGTTKVFSFLFIVSVWLIAFFIQTNILELFSENIEGIVLLLGAFLLAMFVHLPHKPSFECTDKSCNS